VHDRVVLPVGGVGDVDGDPGAVENLGETLLGEGVDARVGGRWDRLMPVLIKFGDEL
jgi:hypothetical protein